VSTVLPVDNTPAGNSPADASPADDRAGALLGLVLRAVDQRLGTVREQFAELANSVARNHADLQAQIFELGDLVATQASPPGATPLLEVANLLTERVQFLESRVNQHTDDRVAELRALLDQLLPAAPPMIPASVPAVDSVAPVAAPQVPESSTLTLSPPAAEFDIDAFSARVHARLAAVVERALSG